jgi:hypothetical protein
MPTAKMAPEVIPVNTITGSEDIPNKAYEWLNITVSAAKILKKSKLF